MSIITSSNCEINSRKAGLAFILTKCMKTCLSVCLYVPDHSIERALLCQWTMNEHLRAPITSLSVHLFTDLDLFLLRQQWDGDV